MNIFNEELDNAERYGDLALIQSESRKIAEKILQILVKNKQMIATAESCTGGLVASRIVDIAGSSQILAGGIIAYQNSVKETLLNVPHDILESKGAVSAETVIAMANGARQKFKCEWAIATSGIAGPLGAEPNKPVGTVWMCVANSLQNATFCKIFPGNRDEVREKSVYSVLSRLLFALSTQNTCTKVQ